VVGRRTRDAEETSGLGRFEIRSVLGWIALLVGGVPFLLLWLLVQEKWSPLASLDGEVAAALNGWVSRSPMIVSALRLVTELGGTGAAVLVLTLTVLFLLIRRRRRLAAFVATTGIGLAVLGPVIKAIVDRARPVVASPVVETPSNASFPSGHAMTALVTWGILLLVALPGVRHRARPWLIAATALLVVAVGFTRLALGVHYVSDVLAGWALGLGWLAVTTAAFRGWQGHRGVGTDAPLDPLHVPPGEAVHLAQPHSSDRVGRRRAAAGLAAWWASVFAVVTILGLLVTAVLSTSWLGHFDRSVVGFLAGVRSPTWNVVANTVSSLSGTRTVVAVGLAAAVMGLAVVRTWRPVVFVVCTLVGEALLYLASSRIVDRLRPEVADLTSGLPSAASWPSGHAAAAIALYGALTALVIAYSRHRNRALIAVPVVIAVAVGLARIYAAAHYPTDVLAGLAFGGVWVLVCARVLLPSIERTANPDRTAVDPRGRTS
jgi:undecaprenyl-diphosphatase